MGIQAYLYPEEVKFKRKIKRINIVIIININKYIDYVRT